MAFRDRIRENLWGRRLGLEVLSSVKTGSTQNVPLDLLVGPEAIRMDVTTAETTSINLKAYGLSNLSTESSGVHTLDPPIPGIPKTIVCTGGATEYVKTRNAETIESSRGSTFTTMKWSAYGVVHLLGLTTARWLGLNLSSGTSSQASSIALSTST
jgi:hypothetical protein